MVPYVGERDRSQRYVCPLWKDWKRDEARYDSFPVIGQDWTNSPKSAGEQGKLTIELVHYFDRSEA